MNNFIFSYNGNKYLEAKKHIFKNNLIQNINDYDIICEPFCGIFGFSRLAYENGFKGEFLLNDLNSDLIKAYNDMKQDINGFLNNIETELNTYKEDKELSQSKTKSYNLKQTSRGLNEKLCNIQKGKDKIRLFKSKKNLYIDMFKKCTFINKSYKEFIKNLPTDKKILIFYDPPYFNSSNTEYQNDFKENEYNDGTIMYIDILNYMKDLNYHQIFIMNRIELINYLFKNFIKLEYGGSYQNSAKKGGTKRLKKHILYSNF